MKQIVGSLLLVLGFAAAAQAQSGYIAGSLSADISRMGSTDGTDLPGTGEALSFSLRAGVPITPRFGVEFDFTRPSEIENDQTPDVSIYADLPVTFLTTLDPTLPLDTILPALPTFNYSIHTTQRITTYTAAAFARQEITPRLAMVYLGGIAFGRVERTLSTSFALPIPIPLASIYPASFDTRTVEYATGPMGGVEAHVGLTDHVQVVPGVRILGLAGGWIIRPAVGLAWKW